MDLIVDFIWTVWVAAVSYAVYDYWKLRNSDWKDL